MADDQEILKLIEQAAKEGSPHLDLSGIQLTSLPSKITQAHQPNEQIFVYFNQKSYAPKSKAETEQWGQVLEFKDKFPKEGLWWPYKGKAEFEKLVRNHLVNYVRTLI